jgi:hypothetical protein
VTARSFTFDATCRVCGSDLAVDRHESPTHTIRRCRATCTTPTCGRQYILTLTMRALVADSEAVA